MRHTHYTHYTHLQNQVVVDLYNFYIQYFAITSDSNLILLLKRITCYVSQMEVISSMIIYATTTFAIEFLM